MRAQFFAVIAALPLWFCLSAKVAAETTPLPAVLTNVAQLRRLTATEAARAYPVHLRGVVMDAAAPRERAVIFADATAGAYLLATNNLFTSYRRGDFLDVEGVSDPGEFAPMVRVTSVRRLGRTNTPVARPVTYHELVTGAMDAQWVEITGIVRRCIEPASNATDVWRLMIAADGGFLPVRPVARDPNIQDDAEVRVQAICLYQFNQKRQVLTPVLQMLPGVPVTVTKPAPEHPFDASVRPAGSLLQFAAEGSPGHRVHVRGVVTHAQPGLLVWIRDESSGLRIQARQQEDLKAGDEIDVLGFPSYGKSSPVLEDAIFRKAGSRQPPAPLALTHINAAFDHEDDLVATEATLTEVQPVLEGLVLTLDHAGTVFKAVLRHRGSWAADPDWQPGSQVRVTGICSVLYDDLRPLMGVWRPQTFQILLRSTADVTVLARPPWWTAHHIVYVLGLVSVGLVLATGVVMLITRRRLHEQAHRRAMAEAEFAAILSERNRVAREIHDTLAQGLAATSVQLRLARKHADGDEESLNHHLDTAQQLVRGSLEEARNSIWNMRSQVLETGDLPGALSGILKQMADGAELRTQFEVKGRARRFAPVIENNLLRIGQEAITNAAQHARAKEIRVMLDFDEKEFRLTVWDDGRGFDPAHPPKSEGGFGLVGMRERTVELKGDLQIRSALGEGAQVQLTVPLAGE
jgi:signal transduction histidine kinase